MLLDITPKATRSEPAPPVVSLPAFGLPAAADATITRTVEFPKFQNLSKISELYYLLNTNLQNKLKISNDKTFIFYQGHHFTQDAQNSNLILPGCTFLEKNGMYINLEQFNDKDDKLIRSPIAVVISTKPVLKVRFNFI